MLWCSCSPGAAEGSRSAVLHTAVVLHGIFFCYGVVTFSLIYFCFLDLELIVWQMAIRESTR